MRARAIAGPDEQPERLFAGLGVRDAVGHRAGSTGSLRVADRVGQGKSFGSTLKPSMLVEEAHVDVEDPVADDPEAEVAQLDHTGVDRPDRDLHGVVSAHAHRPAVERRIVVEQQPERLVPVEADAVDVGRLALVPARGGDEVDERRCAAAAHRDVLEARAPVRADEQRTHQRAAGRRVKATETRARGERSARPHSVRMAVRRLTRLPPRASATSSVPRQPEGRTREREQGIVAAAVRTVTPRRPVALPAGLRRAFPAVVSSSAWTSPRKPNASSSAAAAAAQPYPAWKPPATISTSLAKSGDRAARRGRRGSSERGR